MSNTAVLHIDGEAFVVFTMGPIHLWVIVHSYYLINTALSMSTSNKHLIPSNHLLTFWQRFDGRECSTNLQILWWILHLTWGAPTSTTLFQQLLSSGQNLELQTLALETGVPSWVTQHCQKTPLKLGHLEECHPKYYMYMYIPCVTTQR